VSRGWKAPGWQLSDECYEILLEHGYWLADQVYNRPRRPVGLRVYELTSSNRIHGHLGHLGGHNPNELEFLWQGLLSLTDEKFGFVKDFVK